MRRSALAALLLLLFATPPARAESRRTSFGSDLVISEDWNGGVVSVLGDIRVEAPVSGDVVLWGGDLSFGPRGSVGGDVWVFGGQIAAPPGSSALPVAGAVSTPGSLLSLYLAELERAPWDPRSRSSALLGLRLIALAIWLLASVLLLYVLPSPLARAVVHSEDDWPGTLLAGILGVLTLFLSATAVLVLLPSALSVPLAALIGIVAVAAKVFGMAALFLLVGQKILRNVAPRRRPAALTSGFAALGGISLLPVIGPLLWSAASVAAVGIAFASRFGRPRFRVAAPATP